MSVAGQRPFFNLTSHDRVDMSVCERHFSGGLDNHDYRAETAAGLLADVPSFD